MYKLIKDIISNQITIVNRLSDNAWIPFAPDNTDYANFKREINEGTAQLEDADGVVMSSEAAKQFVSTLP